MDDAEVVWRWRKVGRTDTEYSRKTGDPISAITFIIYLERVMDVIRDNDTEVQIQGHKISNLEDSRLVKGVVFGEMEGKIKRGRPCREWLDDVKECCNEEINELKERRKIKTHGKSSCQCIGLHCMGM